MKIQEMRSGISLLNKKTEGEGRENAFGTAAAPAPELETRPDPGCELDEPLWSLVSFDKREAGGLTYRQASALMTALDAHGINGLCIVTDEAAKRYDT